MATNNNTNNNFKRNTFRAPHWSASPVGVMVLGKGETVVRQVAFYGKAEQAEYKVFKGDLTREHADSSRVNVLDTLVETIASLKNPGIIINVYANDLLVEQFKSEQYKDSLAIREAVEAGKLDIDKIKSVISEEEYLLWLHLEEQLFKKRRFVKLYKLSQAKQERDSRGRITPHPHRELNEKLMAAMWDEVAKTEEIRQKKTEEEEIEIILDEATLLGEEIDGGDVA